MVERTAAAFATLRDSALRQRAGSRRVTKKSVVMRLPAPARRDNMRNPMTSGTGYPHEANTPAQDDLRHRIATAIRDQSAAIESGTESHFAISRAVLLVWSYTQ